MIETLTAVAEPLFSVVQVVWPRVRRMYQEWQAGQMPYSGGNDLMEQGLDQTLDRLGGGDVDDTWWRTLLSRIGHQYVAPDFLRKPALQEWLANEQVQTDFKALARARILHDSTDDPEALIRLRRAYSQSTGEHKRLAEGPITVVLAILAAGYLGSIDSSLEPIAGMIQGSARESREAFGRVEEQLGDVQRRPGELGPYPYAVQAHSERAERELDLLCKQRSLLPERVRRGLLALAQRVIDGDLRYAKPAIRAEVQYWTARVHATQPEMLFVARQYLEQLRQSSPGTDMRIIEALILETESDVDRSLQILRDINTPDGRATLFGTLVRTRGAGHALSWFDEQVGHDDASFLTGLGWSNVAVSLAKMGRWEEAADRLAAPEEHQEAWPGLVFREGIINVAMLCPNEWRQYVFVVAAAHRAQSASDAIQILQALLIAGAAFQREDAWAEWLEEQLTGVASRLPAGEPSKAFYAHLQELKKVLKLTLGIHIRAEALASAAN